MESWAYGTWLTEQWAFEVGRKFLNGLMGSPEISQGFSGPLR